MTDPTTQRLPENSVLLTLESLWRTQNLTQSGHELSVSTATVSRSLSSARTHFGDPLFVRSGPRMMPTETMKRLAPRIAEILKLTRALTTPDVFVPEELSRRIRIAAADNGVLAFLAGGIERIRRRAPVVTFEVTGIHGDLFEDLRYRRLDLALFPFSPIPDDCRSLVLTDEPDLLMVRRGHPLAELFRAKGVLTQEDVNAYPKIRITNVSNKFPASVVRHHDGLLADEEVGAFLALPYFLAAPWFVLESDATAKILERTGRAVAKYLPIELLPLPGIAHSYERRIVWHERAADDPALQWVIAMLHAAVSEGN